MTETNQNLTFDMIEGVEQALREASATQTLPQFTPLPRPSHHPQEPHSVPHTETAVINHVEVPLKFVSTPKAHPHRYQLFQKLAELQNRDLWAGVADTKSNNPLTQFDVVEYKGEQYVVLAVAVTRANRNYKVHIVPRSSPYIQDGAEMRNAIEYCSDWIHLSLLQKVVKPGETPMMARVSEAIPLAQPLMLPTQMGPQFGMVAMPTSSGMMPANMIQVPMWGLVPPTAGGSFSNYMQPTMTWMASPNNFVQPSPAMFQSQPLMLPMQMGPQFGMAMPTSSGMMPANMAMGMPTTTGYVPVGY